MGTRAHVLRELVAPDLHRCRARKVALPQHIRPDALVLGERAVRCLELREQLAGVLTLARAYDERELLGGELVLRPQIARGKYTQLFAIDALERGLDVLGVHV